MRETPPRAWGRPVRMVKATVASGNTPTGVGKTAPLTVIPCIRRKHPHGRGEDDADLRGADLRGETPPRAWGRRVIHRGGDGVVGNTPTGVGKTTATVLHHALGQKHPHGRGEDNGGGRRNHYHLETPPRAWGRPLFVKSVSDNSRNTPTGVGKTETIQDIKTIYQKHPHGRGEDKPLDGKR